MFFTYLRRELTGRRKQTAIIATGMAIAIAQIQTDITAVLPDTTVSTQADLAASVSGSLAQLPPCWKALASGSPLPFSLQLS